jgi:hypothetical protein
LLDVLLNYWVTALLNYSVQIIEAW